MKKSVVFILGFISGAVVLFAVLLLIAKGMENNPTKIQGLTLFEQPGEVLKSPSYEVLQVVDGGNALANAESGYGLHMGMVVLFLADENSNYYDDQIIKVPQGRCVRQVGTYQYPTSSFFTEYWRSQSTSSHLLPSKYSELSLGR